MTSKGMAS